MSEQLLPNYLQQPILRYIDGLKEVLAESLVGVYIYGSVARGCSHAATSDVDVIAIIRNAPATDDLGGVLQVHKAAGVPLDAVFVTADQIRVNAFPAPVAFLVKSALGEGGVFPKPQGCSDFLLQRQDAYEADLVLYGPSPRHLWHPVPWPLLAQSLDYLFPYIRSHFKNPVLMLCRIAYAHTHHSLCSKYQAGVWAVGALDARWKPVIQIALAEYAGGIAASSIQKDTVCMFEKWCKEYIDSVGGLQPRKLGPPPVSP